MNPPHSPPLHLTSRYRLIGLVLAVSAILMGMVLFLHFWSGIPISRLTRDPVALGELSVYAGFLSQAGIFFWSASATLCLFSARVLSGNTEHQNLRLFLLVSGLLTLLLGLDDTFLLHEKVLPHFGIPQNLVLGSYAGFVLLYLFRFYPLILETEYVLLVIALSFFAVSVILDVLEPPGISLFFFEDGAKLTGIVSWLAYFFRVGEDAVYFYGARQNAAPDRHSDRAP